MALIGEKIDQAADGTIRRPRLHDGHVVGLLTEEGSARVLLREEGGVPHTLELRGVRRLRADSFMEGNIILDAVVRRVSGADRELLIELYFEGKTRGGRDLSFVDDLLQSNLALVVISPSYGCSLLALCEEARLHRGHLLLPEGES